VLHTEYNEKEKKRAEFCKELGAGVKRGSEDYLPSKETLESWEELTYEEYD
jgi:hypothetical protein